MDYAAAQDAFIAARAYMQTCASEYRQAEENLRHAKTRFDDARKLLEEKRLAFQACPTPIDYSTLKTQQFLELPTGTVIRTADLSQSKRCIISRLSKLGYFTHNYGTYTRSEQR